MSTAKRCALAAPLALFLAFATGVAAQETEAEAKKEAKAKKATVALEAKNESGITGTATIVKAMEAEKPHAHRITVNLSGAAAGTYPVHIHRGTCESGGGVATGLTSVTVEANESMASSTTVVTPEQLAAADRPEGEARAKAEMEGEAEAEGMAEAAMTAEKAGERMKHGPLFIQAHLADGTPAACGNISHGSHKGAGHEKKPEGQEGEGGTDR